MEVSFVIPTLNSQKTITDCLLSIESQKTNFSFEIIVIDNGSSDNTVSSVKKLSTDIKIGFENKRGAGHARNLGIAMARGKYIAFIDSDVILDENWLELLLQYIKKNQLAGAQGVVFPSGDKKKLLTNYRQENSLFKTSKTHISLFGPDKEEIRPFINTAACIYKKEAIIKVGKFKDYRMFEDYDLSMKVSLISGDLGSTTSAIAYVYYENSIWNYLKRSFYSGVYWGHFSNDWLGFKFRYNRKTKTKEARIGLLFLSYILSFVDFCGQLFYYIFKRNNKRHKTLKFLSLFKQNNKNNAIIDDQKSDFGDFYHIAWEIINGKRKTKA